MTISNLWKSILYTSCIIVGLSSIIPLTVLSAHGDGFYQENLPPASVGNRAISLFIKINPPILTSDTVQDRYLLFRWFDANTNQTLQHATFLVEVAKGSQLLVRGLFHTHTGIMTLRITPSYNQSEWRIIGTPEKFLDRYMYLPQDNGTIDLVAPCWEKEACTTFMLR